MYLRRGEGSRLVLLVGKHQQYCVLQFLLLQKIEHAPNTEQEMASQPRLLMLEEKHGELYGGGGTSRQGFHGTQHVRTKKTALIQYVTRGFVH